MTRIAANNSSENCLPHKIPVSSLVQTLSTHITDTFFTSTDRRSESPLPSTGLVLTPEAVSSLVSCLLSPTQISSLNLPCMTYGSGLAQAFHVGDNLQVLSGKHLWGVLAWHS